MSDQIEVNDKSNSEGQPLLNDGLAALDCPNCPNQGWYQALNNSTQDCEQVQCEFCYATRNSKFNVGG